MYSFLKATCIRHESIKLFINSSTVFYPASYLFTRPLSATHQTSNRSSIHSSIIFYPSTHLSTHTLSSTRPTIHSLIYPLHQFVQYILPIQISIQYILPIQISINSITIFYQSSYPSTHLLFSIPQTIHPYVSANLSIC